MASNGKKYVRLSKCSLGFALGLANGLGLMVLALAGLYWNYGLVFIQELTNLYYGYAATLIGSLYGLGWGFLDGFIFGFLVALFYNCCVCWCKKDKA